MSIFQRQPPTPSWAAEMALALQNVQRTISVVQAGVKAVLSGQQVLFKTQEDIMALSDELIAAVQRVENDERSAISILQVLAAHSAATGSVPDSMLQDALARLGVSNTALETETAKDTPAAPASPSV